jgi:group I intron endonuclease
MEGEVYKATSLWSGKSYIGVTIRGFEVRKEQHEKTAARGSSNCFHKAIRKHGRENFVWEVIETPVYKNKIDLSDNFGKKEKYYISKFDSYHNGYNSQRGGFGLSIPYWERTGEPRPKYTGELMEKIMKNKIKRKDDDIGLGWGTHIVKNEKDIGLGYSICQN